MAGEVGRTGGCPVVRPVIGVNTHRAAQQVMRHSDIDGGGCPGNRWSLRGENGADKEKEGDGSPSNQPSRSPNQAIPSRGNEHRSVKTSLP